MGLCEVVYGMPLGIELAAAWAANAGVATVRRQLHHNLEELAVGYHDMPSRHRSSVRPVYGILAIVSL